MDTKKAINKKQIVVTTINDDSKKKFTTTYINYVVFINIVHWCFKILLLDPLKSK